MSDPKTPPPTKQAPGAPPKAAPRKPEAAVGEVRSSAPRVAVVPPVDPAAQTPSAASLTDLASSVLNAPIAGLQSVKRQSVNQFKSINERFEQGEWNEIAAHELAIVAPWRILIITIKNLLADRVLMRASSLAFITVTSLVPILVVAGSLIMVFSGGSSDEGFGLVDVIQSYLMPVAGDRVSSFIRSAIERTNQSGVGSLGGLALIFTAVTLIMEIEDSFNDIWKVSQRRPLRTRVLLFYTLVTIGPLILTLSVIQTTRVGVAMEQFGAIGSLAHQLVPLLSSALGFALANKLMPNTRVSWRAALIAALVSALAFEATKFGFTYYISNVVMARYDQIYGPLSLFPVFLLWVYISWVLVLFGAELSYCLQHLRQLMRSDRVEKQFTRTEEAAQLASPFIGVELMAPIAWHFFQGKKPLNIDQIVERSGQSHVMAIKALKRLEYTSFLIRVEREGAEIYIPARPLEQIKLLELIEVFEVDFERMRPRSTVRQIAERLADSRRTALAELTCQDLAVAMVLGTKLEHITTSAPVHPERLYSYVAEAETTQEQPDDDDDNPDHDHDELGLLPPPAPQKPPPPPASLLEQRKKRA